MNDKKNLTSKQKLGIIVASVLGVLILLGGGCVGCVSCMNSMGWLVDDSNSSGSDTTSSIFEAPSYSEIENNNSSEIEISDSENSSETSQQNLPVRNEQLNGRGRADTGRNEPSYIGIIGYAVISYSKEYELSKTDKFNDTSLWTIPTYEKDKQFWYVTDYTLPHKTEIVVIEQYLKHEGYGAYSGYLLVEEINSKKQVYINVDNYITKPYWTYTDDLVSAVKVGNFVAEFNQKSDFYPVNKSGKRVKLDDGVLVLVQGTTGLMSGVKDTENGIKAIVWKEWEYGYGGVDVYFNVEDLSIIY